MTKCYYKHDDSVGSVSSMCKPLSTCHFMHVDPVVRVQRGSVYVSRTKNAGAVMVRVARMSFGYSLHLYSCIFEGLCWLLFHH